MKPLIQVLGPTGVGKSRMAFVLAKKFAAEIISADSVQVYQGFDIGTDKVDAQGRSQVPHHLIDIIGDCSQFNASRFLELAFRAAEDIHARGKVPLVCGGTALYLRIMQRGIFAEKKDAATRRQLLDKASRLGWPALWAELQDIDPAYARKIGPNDRVRLVRALEIHRHCAMPPSAAFARSHSPFCAYRFIRIGLELERGELYRRIDRRAELMLQNGLLDEVRGLLRRYPADCPPFKALGYKEMAAHLRGEIGLPEALQAMQRHSRQFAKRQLSWFRQEKDIHWFMADDSEGIAAFISQCLTKKS
jgi:tRNA dimethylallyltransferase